MGRNVSRVAAMISMIKILGMVFLASYISTFFISIKACFIPVLWMDVIDLVVFAIILKLDMKANADAKSSRYIWGCSNQNIKPLIP